MKSANTKSVALCHPMGLWEGLALAPALLTLVDAPILTLGGPP